MQETRRFMIALTLTLVIAYGAVVGGLYTFQRKLLYAPDRDIQAPAAYGLETFQEAFTHSRDGIRLHLWRHEAQPGFPTVVYFHGNAAHLGNRAGIYGALAARGFGVLALSYRGYGKSEGEPSEEGLYADARAALEYAWRETRATPRGTILYGESLGTGVAVQMAAEYAVGALVLQAAYTSVVTRAAEIYFYIPVRLLIKDRFDSLTKISHIKPPLLLLHGERDATIPVAHGRLLFEAARVPKEAVYFPNVQHTDFDSDDVSKHVLNFAHKQGVFDHVGN